MKISSETKLGKLLTPLALAALVPALASTSCKKDKPPPPLPSAEPVKEPSAPVVLEIEEPAVPDAGDDAAKKVGKYRPGASLKACCNALSQNAANAPPPTNAYMLQAAAACHAAVAQGKDKGSIIAVVRGALRGAGMPGACR